MSTKQILRHAPVFKKTFCTLSGRTYGPQHVVTSCKVYHRLLHLRESTISGTFSNLSLRSTIAECNRRFSYSCRCGSSNSSNFDLGSVSTMMDDLKKHTEERNDAKQTQTEDPELESLIKEIDEDFKNDSRKLNRETTVDEEEQKHQMKVEDLDSQLDKNLNDVVDVNKKNPEFEYDYQVAEDIEEYDYLDENTHMQQQIRSEKVLPISLTRGKNGVFDLHELVTLLEHLGAENIVTVPVPPEASFCDDMVVVSAKSRRHLQAINEEMLWVHKRKKAKQDPHLVIEGLDKSDWCAMDIGNIILHVFYGDLREYYDIESLWLLGPDRDPKCQKQSADSYVLSAEDLFWLETGQAKGKVTDQDDSSTTDSDKQVDLASAEESVSEKSDYPDQIRR